MTPTAQDAPAQVAFACVRNGARSVISRVLTEHYAGGRVRSLLVELLPDMELPPSVLERD